MKNNNFKIQKIYSQMALWLKFCAITTFIIIILGGMTRLSGSGLSIASINVFSGIIPPLNTNDWQKSFNKYKTTLEYKITYNKKMNLKGYKKIFILEYLHRLFGRILAILIFMLPFLYFIIRFFFIKRFISGKIILKLLNLFLLGSLQGIIGWLMVKSGLNNETALIRGEEVRVNPYRLVTHLSLALIIYSYMLKLIFDLLYKCNKSKIKQIIEKKRSLIKLKRLAYLISIFICLNVVIGGFVAGTHAGLVYKTFPLMNNYFIPPDLYNFKPWYLSFFEHMSTVQFHHRIVAYIIVILIIIFCIYIKNFNLPNKTIKLAYALIIMVFLQAILGILTLLNFKPKTEFTIILGTLHQIGALILLTLSLKCNFYLNLYLSKKTRITIK